MADDDFKIRVAQKYLLVLLLRMERADDALAEIRRQKEDLIAIMDADDVADVQQAMKD